MDRPLNRDSVVVAVADQLSRDIDGETVILNLEHGTYFGLNRTGSLIWGMLRAPVRVADLRDAISSRYGVPAASVETDVLSLLSEMIDRGLVRLAARQ